MKQNKHHGLNSTSHNLQMWPYEQAKESLCLLSGPIEWKTDAKNVNDSYIFDLRSYVIAKHSDGSEEIAGRRKKITACVKQLCLWGVICKVSIRKTSSGETFCFLEKHLLFLHVLKPVLRVTYCLLTSCWLAYEQLFCNVLLFSCNVIGQLCQSGPSYNSHTVICGRHPVHDAALQMKPQVYLGVKPVKVFFVF